MERILLYMDNFTVFGLFLPGLKDLQRSIIDRNHNQPLGRAIDSNDEFAIPIRQKTALRKP